MHAFWNAKRRLWLYNIAVAAVPVLVTYGVLNTEQGGVWLALVGAALGTVSPAIARANVTPEVMDGEE